MAVFDHRTYVASFGDSRITRHARCLWIGNGRRGENGGGVVDGRTRWSRDGGDGAQRRQGDVDLWIAEWETTRSNLY